MSDHDASRRERQRIADETANVLFDDLSDYAGDDWFYLKPDVLLMLSLAISQAIERVRIYERGGELYERK